MLAELEKDGASWVLLFTGTLLPQAEEHQDPPYEMDEPYPSGLHTDLKRDTRMRQAMRRADNGTAEDPQAGLPLFEKYMFLTPGTSLPQTPRLSRVLTARTTGLFMGLTVFLVLLLILYVGITAIAGLEVSCAAFSKEMGPAAQNKGKQQ